MRDRWNSPERGIWSIVSGLPDGKARERRLCMLQVYFDDSGKVDQSPVQVLAGYLASAESWANFSVVWQSILDDYKIEYFRMSQAWRMARMYRHLSSIQRDEMIIRLIRCIHDHVERAFAVSVPFDAHAHWMGSNEFPDNQSLRAYTGAFWFAMCSVYKYGYDQRFDQPIEVIFDEQGGESMPKILASVDQFREVSAVHFPNYRIPFPQFKEDKDTLPLQAADLVAWLVRRDAYNMQKADRMSLPETILLNDAYFDLPHSKVIITENQLEMMSNMVAESLMKIIDGNGLS